MQDPQINYSLSHTITTPPIKDGLLNKERNENDKYKLEGFMAFAVQFKFIIGMGIFMSITYGYRLGIGTIIISFIIINSLIAYFNSRIAKAADLIDGEVININQLHSKLFSSSAEIIDHIGSAISFINCFSYILTTRNQIYLYSQFNSLLVQITSRGVSMIGYTDHHIMNNFEWVSMMIILSLFIYPMCVIDNLSTMKYLSFMSLVLCICCLMVIGIQLLVVEPKNLRVGESALERITMFGVLESSEYFSVLVSFFGLIALSLENSPTTLPYRQSLKHPTDFNYYYYIVVAFSTIMTIVLSVIVSYSYGSSIDENILFNFLEDQNYPLGVLIICQGFTLGLGMPMSMFPAWINLSRQGYYLRVFRSKYYNECLLRAMLYTGTFILGALRFDLRDVGNLNGIVNGLTLLSVVPVSFQGSSNTIADLLHESSILEE